MNIPQANKLSADGTILNWDEIEFWLKSEGYPVCEQNILAIVNGNHDDLLDNGDYEDIMYECGIQDRENAREY